MKPSFFPRTALSFVFYACLILTTPQYVECEDLYPDETLDVLGMPSPTVVTIEHDAPATLFPDLARNFSERRHQENPRVALFTGKLVRSVTLLC